MPTPSTALTPRLLTAAALLGTLALAACGSAETSSNSAPAPATSDPAPAAAGVPFGPACAAVPASGPGSLGVIANEPVATAASRNPGLSTLVSAVTKAGLVDTLNNAPAITVFAPTNDAFAKIPADTLAKVLADKQALTNILTYHVVEQRQEPTDLDSGTLTTLQGGAIQAARSGDTYTADDARVVCGNVQTRNATVYLIDTVLMPKS
ncbi:fasciclin domain-containing protein [Actinomycetes bacterium KLBMP 9797]